MHLDNSNQKFLKENNYFLILFIVIFIIHQFIFQKFFPGPKGLLGHDYEQFVPNLMFGKVWFKNNFLSIPWFTPSFCCGIPFFPDPQSMYYSIPQIIFLIFNPIFSIKIIFFILSAFSYIGMFLLMRKNFKFNIYVSLLCASLFLFNGFFVYRAIAGHVAYLSYIFVPLYCFFLINSYESKSESLNNIYLILSAIIFANFFHSGSGPIIFIIFTSILSVLLLYSHLINSLRIIFKLILSLILGTLIALSKIIASLFFLSNFPRQYPAMEFHSIISFIQTFFLSFFLNPNEQYFNENIKSMFPFGVHEIEYSLSVVPIILLFFVFFLNKKFFKFNYYNIRLFFLLTIIFFIPILFNVNFLNQFKLIQTIPFLNSTWVQVRWMLIYILPIIILAGLIIESIDISFKKKYLAISLIFILLAQNLIKDKSWHVDDQKYNIKNATDFSLKIKKEIDLEIKGPAILMNEFNSPKKINNKNDMFFYSWSPLTCYQPIFGYGLGILNASKIKFNKKEFFEDNSYVLYSSKFDENNGRFMFFNPSCFLFPKENNCLPGDTFEILDKEKLVKFTNYEKFAFNQNKIQLAANYISLFTFTVSIIYLIYNFIIFLFRLRKGY